MNELDRLPAVLTLHLAQLFLHDRDVRAYAQVNQHHLRLLSQQYGLKSEVCWYLVPMLRLTMSFQSKWSEQRKEETWSSYIIAKGERLDLSAKEKERGPTHVDRIICCRRPADHLPHQFGLNDFMTSDWSNRPAAAKQYQIGRITRLKLRPARMGGVTVLLSHLRFIPPSVVDLLITGGGDLFTHPLQEIESLIFPPKLSHLYLEGFQTHLFFERSQPFWPTSLQTLRLACQRNRASQPPLKEIFLPNSITDLYLDHGVFACEEANQLKLPSGLVKLVYLGFQHTLVGWNLPPLLKSLGTSSAAYECDHSGWVMPSELEEIKFNNRFNSPLQTMILSPKLKSVQFSPSFNHSLIGVEFPLSFDTCMLGSHYEPPLVSLNGSLPTTLTNLTYYAPHTMNGDDSSLDLPSSLIRLDLYLPYVYGESDHKCKLIRLPKTSLKALRIFNCSSYTPPDIMDSIPLTDSIQELSFNDRFDADLSGLRLPARLIKIDFGGCNRHDPRKLKLPDTIQEITFGSKFNHSLVDCRLPRSLIRLTLGQQFQQSLVGIKFPDGLRYLTLHRCYDQDVTGLLLPAQLESLAFGEPGQPFGMTHFLSFTTLLLPHSLRILVIPHPQPKTGCIPKVAQEPYRQWLNGLEQDRGVHSGWMKGRLQILFSSPIFAFK